MESRFSDDIQDDLFGIEDTSWWFQYRARVIEQIAAGCPARPLRKRFSENIITRLLVAQWWKLPDIVLKENLHLFSAEMNESNLEKIERLCAKQ